MDIAALLALREGTTPGPWILEILFCDDPNGDETDTEVEITAQDGFLVHNHDLQYRADTDEKIKANARLIAAAPDMLDAIAALQAEVVALTARAEAADETVTATTEALQKVAGFRGGYNMPFPEIHDGYGSYAVVTAREALALIGGGNG